MRHFRGLWIAAFSLLFVLSVSTRPAQAQQWAQEVQIVTSVKSEQPTRAFLDSLVTKLKDQDTVRVRRKPAGERMALDSLQSTLLDRGIGLFSANGSLSTTGLRFETTSLSR